MNKALIASLVLLIIASAATYLLRPESMEKYPLVEWMSDSNPQRFEQTELFDKWLREKHPELAENKDLPAFGIKLSAANNQSTIIQAVSGVAGDLIDHLNVPVFAAMGLLKPLGEDAKKQGFDLNETYPNMETLLGYEGEQYGYPCNVVVSSFIFNEKTLKRYGMSAPRETWSTEDFEKFARKFMENTNQGSSRRTIFYTIAAESLGETFITINVRSYGIDMYNETLTKCIANDKRFYDVYELLYKWTYVDKILPTAAEVASNDTESGFGGAAFSHFINGNYATIIAGRWAMVRFRELSESERFPMTMTLFPQGPFKNAVIGTRATGIYAGSKKYDMAKYFMEFLASKEYNDYIIKYADGLPPNPKYAVGNPDYLSPKEYPNEGNLHEKELEYAMNYALPVPQTPYFRKTGTSWFSFALSKVMAGRATAREAVDEAVERINSGIAESVAANDNLAKLYRRDIELQHKIDAVKATWKYRRGKIVSGEKIPVNWIKNPFYKKYYAHLGMLKGAE